MLSGGDEERQAGHEACEEGVREEVGRLWPDDWRSGDIRAPMTGVAGAGAVWAEAAAVKHSHAHHTLRERDWAEELEVNGTKLRWAGKRQIGCGIYGSQPLGAMGNKVYPL